MKKIIILTTSVFTDRMLQYSKFLNVFSKHYNIEIWAKSYISNATDWEKINCNVIAFPEVIQLPHWINFLRRINEFSWMYSLNSKSLLTNEKYRTSNLERKIQKFIGKIISFLRLNKIFETELRKIIKRQTRSKEAVLRLKENSIIAVVVLNPFWVEEPTVAIEASKFGLPIISIIPSWDNITTKSRIIYDSYAFGVWSNIRIPELKRHYPESYHKKIFCYGTPQYDIFKNSSFKLSKYNFFKHYDLTTKLPVVLYTLGSPHFIESEIYVCREFCEKSIQSGFINKMQILIRPHPNKDFSKYIHLFKELHKNIVVQSEVMTPFNIAHRYQDAQMIKHWVSTFNYADIVIATSSTSILDGAMMNKPHINIAANLSNDPKLDEFIADVTYKFEHLAQMRKEGLFNDIVSWESFFQEINNFIENTGKYINNSELIQIHLAGHPLSVSYYGIDLADGLNDVLSSIF